MRAPGVLALLAVVVLAGCGGDSDPAAEAEPVGDRLVDSVAPLARCSDWKQGTRAERLATIDDIREQINLKDSAVRTPELSDAAAYRVLDNVCRRDFTGSLRLYKLYARADSFAPFAEQDAPR